MTLLSQLFQFIFRQRLVKDISYNPSAAITVFVAYVCAMFTIAAFMNAVADQIKDFPISHVPLPRMAIDALVSLGLYYALFTKEEKQERFTQAITAFYGSGALLFWTMLLANYLPGGQILILLAIMWYPVCMVSATTQSLDYSIFKAIVTLLVISFTADIIANLLFPITFADSLNTIAK